MNFRFITFSKGEVKKCILSYLRSWMSATKIDILKNSEMSKEAIAFQGGVKMSKPQNWS